MLQQMNEQLVPLDSKRVYKKGLYFHGLCLRTILTVQGYTVYFMSYHEEDSKCEILHPRLNSQGESCSSHIHTPPVSFRLVNTARQSYTPRFNRIRNAALSTCSYSHSFSICILYYIQYPINIVTPSYSNASINVPTVLHNDSALLQYPADSQSFTHSNSELFQRQHEFSHCSS